MAHKKIIVPLLTVSWAADGALPTCHVELVMTLSFDASSTVATHKVPNYVYKLKVPFFFLPSIIFNHLSVNESKKKKKTHTQTGTFPILIHPLSVVRHPRDYSHLFYIKSN